jgi:seryl-tRNA synthetase
MLQLQFIRDNKENVLQGLAKRNFANAEKIIEDVLAADENRRKIQVSLDNTLAESNKISKEIGLLFKSGEIQKANILKERTGQLKEVSKELNERLKKSF